jgi:hypothetical protein
MQEMKEQMATFIKRLEDEEYEYYYEEDDEAENPTVPNGSETASKIITCS